MHMDVKSLAWLHDASRHFNSGCLCFLWLAKRKRPWKCYVGHPEKVSSGEEDLEDMGCVAIG